MIVKIEWINFRMNNKIMFNLQNRMTKFNQKKFNKMHSKVCKSVKYIAKYENANYSALKLFKKSTQDKGTDYQLRNSLYLQKQIRKITLDYLKDYDRMVNETKSFVDEVGKKINALSKPGPVEVIVVPFSETCPEKYEWEDYLKFYFKMFCADTTFELREKDNMKSIVMIVSISSEKLEESWMDIDSYAKYVFD